MTRIPKREACAVWFQAIKANEEKKKKKKKKGEKVRAQFSNKEKKKERKDVGVCFFL